MRLFITFIEAAKSIMFQTEDTLIIYFKKAELIKAERWVINEPRLTSLKSGYSYLQHHRENEENRCDRMLLSQQTN